MHIISLATQLVLYAPKQSTSILRVYLTAYNVYSKGSSESVHAFPTIYMIAPLLAPFLVAPMVPATGNKLTDFLLARLA